MSYSDDEDFEFSADEEEYDFEYEDDGDGEEQDVDLENMYYNAKAMKEDHPLDAIKEFEAVVDAEQEKGDWGFKSKKQIVKLEFQLGRHGDLIRHYDDLLTYLKKAVTKNYAEKSLNNILEYVSSNDTNLMKQIYQHTLDVLKESNNERLWIKTNLKLAKLYVDNEDIKAAQEILDVLSKVCQSEGENDNSKGTYLLEVYALEIQLCTLTNNNVKLKVIGKLATEAEQKHTAMSFLTSGTL